MPPKTTSKTTISKKINLGYGLDSASCTPGHYGGVFGIGVTQYVPSDIRIFYDLFNEATGAVPQFGISCVFLENYASQATRAVAPATAPPLPTDTSERCSLLSSRTMLLLPIRRWTRLCTSEARRCARRCCSISTDRRAMSTTPSSRKALSPCMDNYSCWRLAKLRRLKEQYDPHNRFSFYAPIQ
ncbi:hypothetical protein B0T24DRAFT_591998 [Lasiosphaeria ovina]|uniref:Berberine/berberine-like domain-containing protein n=1 Tax=Lasiosphaeria ovina TaxID=92902 RepID=A0AAE0KHG3_9PEZI|nr:hypothetical protein B0T24DRAFT_591998 [Lasiosphaeria ovina]